MARGAHFRCRAPLQAGDRKVGAGARSITRSRRKACRRAILRKPLSTPEAAGQIHHARGGGRLFRLACPFGRARYARFKRANAEKAGMAADRTGVDRRSRTLAGLVELKAHVDHPRRAAAGADLLGRDCWRCWRCALERRCYGKPLFFDAKGAKKGGSLSRDPPQTINVALRPLAFPWRTSR